MLQNNRMKTVPMELLHIKLFKLDLTGNPFDEATLAYMRRHPNGSLNLIRTAQEIIVNSEDTRQKAPPFEVQLFLLNYPLLWTLSLTDL